jgi:uncharacterized membrane protein YgaE (UPF0421/DUF939 family)
VRREDKEGAREAIARRSEAVWEEAVRRSRSSAGDRLASLKDLALPVLQSALAAAIAWVFAQEVVGHQSPFFAPVSAVVAIGTTLGQRTRRSIELVVGVSVGIAVADLLIAGIGTGTWQLALCVVLATVAAILVGGGELLRVQAAVSAVLVATLQPPTDGIDFTRSIDALVGGVAALLVAGILPAKPLARVRRAARRAIPELAATIDDVATALRDQDERAAERALERARALDDMTSSLRDEVQTGYEMVRITPPRRTAKESLVTYGEAASQLDLAVRNVRVMARGLVRAFDLDDDVPTELADALDDLSAAVTGLGAALEDEDRVEDARAAAVRAAGRATQVLEQTGNLSVSHLVGQVRSTAADMLRGLGLSREEAREAVREAGDLLASAQAE